MSKTTDNKQTKAEKQAAKDARKAQAATNRANDAAAKKAKSEQSKQPKQPKQPEASLPVATVLRREHVTTTAKAASGINSQVSEFATIGYTIEKDRPAAHGVTRASTNTACETVWAMCDALKQTLSRLPTIAEAREQGQLLGLNKNNVAIEFYRWRKFNGVRGRAAPDGGVKRSKISKFGKDLEKKEAA